MSSTSSIFDSISLRNQAIQEIKLNFDGLHSSTSAQIIKDLAYLIAEYVPSIKDIVPIHVDFDMLVKHLRVQAGVGTNDATTLSSDLSKRLIQHNIIAGTIIPQWNTVIPPLLFETDENVRLFDLSLYKLYYNQTDEILLINYDDLNIAVIEYNTSCRGMSKKEVISDLIIRRLLLPILDSNVSFSSSTVDSLLEITSFLGLSRNYLAASMVQLLVCPPAQLDSCKHWVGHKEHVLKLCFEALNIDISLVPKAIQISQLFNNIDAVEHILSEQTYSSEPLPQLM